MSFSFARFLSTQQHWIRFGQSSVRVFDTIKLKSAECKIVLQRLSAPVQNLSRKTKLTLAIIGTTACTTPFLTSFDPQGRDSNNTKGDGKEIAKNSPFDISFYRNPINAPTVKVMAVNLAVFIAWQMPVAQPFLRNHFALSVNNVLQGRIHTLLTCCFSHAGLLHFLFNQIALSSFGAGGLIDRLVYYKAKGLGQTSLIVNAATNDWWALYLGAGLSSSVASLANFTLRRNYYGTSIGASGSVIGMLFSYAHNHPDATFGIIGLPFINFSAANGAKALVVFDTVGLLLGKGKLDHAGHLGGTFAGLASESYRIGSLEGAKRLLFEI